MACTCGPGIMTAALRGGSMWSARIITPLAPASIMHTAAISPKSLWLAGGSPLIAAAMFRAATLAIDSVGDPALGIPIGKAVWHGSGTLAAIPDASICRYD